MREGHILMVWVIYIIFCGSSNCNPFKNCISWSRTCWHMSVFTRSKYTSSPHKRLHLKHLMQCRKLHIASLFTTLWMNKQLCEVQKRHFIFAKSTNCSIYSAYVKFFYVCLVCSIPSSLQLTLPFLCKGKNKRDITS